VLEWQIVTVLLCSPNGARTFGEDVGWENEPDRSVFKSQGKTAKQGPTIAICGEDARARRCIVRHSKAKVEHMHTCAAEEARQGTRVVKGRVDPLLCGDGSDMLCFRQEEASMVSRKPQICCRRAQLGCEASSTLYYAVEYLAKVQSVRDVL
jgi:hypothetical protein